jgi:hypothetical protein
LDQSFVDGVLQTKAGPVPRVSSSLRLADRRGSYRVRWGIGRMDYTVDPGLYALGNPGEHSPVLVSANYKMSFDRLRSALPGRDAWILVLDTRGVNVWCAAGKGTMGTAELLLRIQTSGLNRILSHRELILPQLSGPGISAHLVKKSSGFKVIYGPIRATDLTAFLDAGLKASPGMRLKTFTFRERAVLVPVEIVGFLKPSLALMAAFFLVDSLWSGARFWPGGVEAGLGSVLSILVAVLMGAVLAPLLLPWLPGRAFSLKGAFTGLLGALLLMASRPIRFASTGGRLEIAAWFFLIPAISAYLAMNFTGASTFTSLSGVKKEMRRAVPVEIGAAFIGLGLWVGSHLI